MKKKLQRLLWEQTVNKITGNLAETFERPYVGWLRSLAESKMWSISAISAKFGNNSAFMVPKVCLLLHTTQSREYYALFEQGFVQGEPRTPNCLVRRALWNINTDWNGFLQSTDKCKYIESERQLVVQNIFGYKTKYRKLLSLATELEKYSLGGIAFKQCKNRDSKWINISLQVGLENMGWSDLNYNPHQLKNAFLDNWINRFVVSVNAVDMTKGIKPENGFEVSYIRESPMDYISDLRKIEKIK